MRVYLTMNRRTPGGVSHVFLSATPTVAAAKLRPRPRAPGVALTVLWSWLLGRAFRGYLGADLTTGGRHPLVLCVALAMAPGLALADPQPVLAASPKSAEELFGKLATLKGLEATFVETKQMALLRMPLRSEGTLFYMRPGYLLRKVTAPKPSQVLITPHSLELRDAQGSRTMDLRARPDVKMFVESFLKVLAGEREALAKVFEIQFARIGPSPGGAPENARAHEWTLTLTPKSSPLNQIVQKLVLSGSGYAVQTIEVLETKGDSATTVLRVKAVDRAFSDAEKQSLFGIAPSAPPQ